MDADKSAITLLQLKIQDSHKNILEIGNVCNEFLDSFVENIAISDNEIESISKVKRLLKEQNFLTIEFLTEFRKIAHKDVEFLSLLENAVEMEVGHQKILNNMYDLLMKN